VEAFAAGGGGGGVVGLGGPGKREAVRVYR